MSLHQTSIEHGWVFLYVVKKIQDVSHMGRKFHSQQGVSDLFNSNLLCGYRDDALRRYKIFSSLVYIERDRNVSVMVRIINRTITVAHLFL